MEKKIIYGLFGAGGYGREVMPLARLTLQDQLLAKRADLVFVGKDDRSKVALNGKSTMSETHFLSLPNPKYFNIAIANSKLREKIASVCINSGATPFPIIADNVIIMDENVIDKGAILSPFVTITSNTQIGSFFHANIYSFVAHDCIIGDFVTFAPSVKCNGNVVIGDHAYLGTGASIMPGKEGDPLIIGKGAVIGMGAVVTKNVPSEATVIGNPAYPIS